MIKRLLKAKNVDDEKYPAKNLMYFINNAKDEGLRAHRSRPTTDQSARWSSCTKSTTSNASAKAWSISPSCCCAPTNCCSVNQPLREHYQARFRHILVDEFQDTNDLQYNWLKLLAGQASRRWRAVRGRRRRPEHLRVSRRQVGNMAAFEREFRVQNLIKLEQNYRSHGHILDSANELIANNSKRLGKNLRTDAGQGEPVRVYEASSDLAEAQWIIEESARACIATARRATRSRCCTAPTRRAA